MVKDDILVYLLDLNNIVDDDDDRKYLLLVEYLKIKVQYTTEILN